MAIEPIMADVIRKIAPSVQTKRALCLGYPDILADCDAPSDPEQQRICRWHHWRGGIVRAEDFFADLGFEAEYWDVTQARGPERVVDLNELNHWRDWIGDDYGYGLVIDPGTIEHIANIGNCWRTICAVTALDGAVIHCNPLTMANHGFYSIHPTAYVDLYEANGFRIDLLLELSGPLEARKIRELPKHHRYEPAPNAVVLCVARKIEDVAFNWPTQFKYRQNPMLKAAQ